ncbi:MAG: hypothetical protein KDC79_07445 [Cyclobacteriaceae bacterium]|nr:hypothetical protein [Cyclobacteriaceae bacterium]
MDSKRIELLLERYWNCVSTLEEEAELKEYFTTTQEIPEHLKQAAPLFQYFDKEAEVSLNDSSFEEKLLKEVRSHQQPTGKVRRLEQNFQNYMKVAAAIVIVIATSFIFRMEIWKGDKPELLLAEDTYKNPEQAYAETKKALMLIASKMNSGKKEVEKISILSKAESKVKGEKQ